MRKKENHKKIDTEILVMETGMNEPYRILIAGGEAETELKKSRFIAHVQPVETEQEAQDYVNQIKKTFYDARHNCYAYVIGKDAGIVKYSDDGEPAQTGGMPIYNLLKETGVRNAVIVVTRYFGGTLLGAGPLARMYAEAAKLGLEASKTAVMRYGTKGSITADYAEGEKIRRYLEREEIQIDSTDYSEKVTFTIKCGFEQFSKLTKDIVSLTNGNVNPEKIEDAYFIDKQ